MTQFAIHQRKQLQTRHPQQLQLSHEIPIKLFTVTACLVIKSVPIPPSILYSLASQSRMHTEQTRMAIIKQFRRSPFLLPVASQRGPLTHCTTNHLMRDGNSGILPIAFPCISSRSPFDPRNPRPLSSARPRGRRAASARCTYAPTLSRD